MPSISSRQFFLLLVSLLAIFFAFVLHTVLNAPADVSNYLISEMGPFEFMSNLLWVVLAVLCLIQTKIFLTPRVMSSVAASLLAAREMDVHKSLFEMSFIKTNFYKSSDIPLMDKALGFILILLMVIIILYLIKTFYHSYRLQYRHSLSHILVVLTVILGAASKILDRSNSQLNELFNIHLSADVGLTIQSIEESTEMLLPILLIISVIVYTKSSVKN